MPNPGGLRCDFSADLVTGIGIHLDGRLWLPLATHPLSDGGLGHCDSRSNGIGVTSSGGRGTRDQACPRGGPA